jgi:hypothetical protein
MINTMIPGTDCDSTLYYICCCCCAMSVVHRAALKSWVDLRKEREEVVSHYQVGPCS